MIKFSTKDSILGSIYSKLGFHKEFYFPIFFYSKPRFSFGGAGGEILRRYPILPIYECLKGISRGYNFGRIYNSSIKLCNRSIELLKQNKNYSNDYEISLDLYSKGRTRIHFGKEVLEGFIGNIYKLQPLIDPDIRSIKFDKNSNHDLLAYIYVRFAHILINFPFTGNKKLNSSSIKKAEKLNKKLGLYKIKTEYNKNFYIDKKRKAPVSSSKDKNNIYQYLKQIFSSDKFIHIINQLYNKNVYNWAKEYSKKSNYHPLRHGYGLFAVAKTLRDISLNERYYKKMSNEKEIDKLIK